MTRKNLLAYGAIPIEETDDLETRARTARHNCGEIMKNMGVTKNPLHYWEAMRHCARYGAPMPSDIAAYVIRVADALIAGVDIATPARALKFIAEAIELKPKGRGKQVTCFRRAKADAANQVLAIRAETESPKRFAEEKKTSIAQISVAKGKFGKKPSSGKT